MEIIKARRSSLSYIILGAFLAALIERSFFSDHVQSHAAELIWKMVLIPILSLVFIRMILYPNYLIASNGTITIYRDHFMENKVLIEDINHVEISATPFKQSYFVLKSDATIPFSYFDLDSKTSKVFFARLGKPLRDI